MIKLGDRVKDKLTGFEGILTAFVEHLHGCRRLGIEPTDLDKDGKPKDTFYFDEERIVKVDGEEYIVVNTDDAPAETVARKSGGPLLAPTRAQDLPTR